MCRDSTGVFNTVSSTHCPKLIWAKILQTCLLKTLSGVGLLSHFQELLGTGHLSPPTDQETEEAQQASSPHHLCPSHRSASPGPHGARANPGEKSLAKTSFWQANLAVHITKTFQPSHLSSLHYYGTAHHYYKNHCSTTACSHPNLRL